MNVISYTNGDSRITDFPACSARPLAVLVQACNDLLAGADGYLSPENSVLALELAWQTAGTADVCEAVIHAWLAELLTNRSWGVVQYAKISAIKAILDIAELHLQTAHGNIPPIAAWDAADRAARTAAQGMNPASNPAGSYAIRAALEATALVGHPLPTRTLDAVTANALRAHALAHSSARTGRTVELTRQAIRSWRDLAGLDNPRDLAGLDNRRNVAFETEFVVSHSRAGATTVMTPSPPLRGRSRSTNGHVRSGAGRTPRGTGMTW